MEEGYVMTLYTAISTCTAQIAVVGLGYVGMPLAVAFAKKALVIGFDTNVAKIEKYKNGQLENKIKQINKIKTIMLSPISCRSALIHRS